MHEFHENLQHLDMDHNETCHLQLSFGSNVVLDEIEAPLFEIPPSIDAEFILQVLGIELLFKLIFNLTNLMLLNQIPAKAIKLPHGPLILDPHPRLLFSLLAALPRTRLTQSDPRPVHNNTLITAIGLDPIIAAVKNTILAHDLFIEGEVGHLGKVVVGLQYLDRLRNDYCIRQCSGVVIMLNCLLNHELICTILLRHHIKHLLRGLGRQKCFLIGVVVVFVGGFVKSYRVVLIERLEVCVKYLFGLGRM